MREAKLRTRRMCSVGRARRAAPRHQMLARASAVARTRARELAVGLTLRADVDVRLPVHEPTQRTSLPLTYCGDYRSCAITVVAHGLAGFVVDHPRHATRLGSGPTAVRGPPSDTLSGVELGIWREDTAAVLDRFRHRMG
jgi:hypothetical protein